MPRWGHSQNVGLKPFILGMPPPCRFILYINTSCGKIETKKNQQIQQIQSIYIYLYSTHSTIKICKYSPMWASHLCESSHLHTLHIKEETWLYDKQRLIFKLCDLHMFRITITFALCFILG
jgi:hypothetical protein